MKENHITIWPEILRKDIEAKVKKNYEGMLTDWPIIKGFQFNIYKLKNKFVVIHLIDSLSSFIATKDDYLDGEIIPDALAPQQDPCNENAIEWIDYLSQKLNIHGRDIVHIVPIKNEGKTTNKDWELYSENEKFMYNRQQNYNLLKTFHYLKGIKMNNEFFLPSGYEFLQNDAIKFFQDHPDYNKNVFIMTNLSDDPVLKKLDTELRKILTDNGLVPVRADDKMYGTDRNLWNNVCLYMLCCKYGIAVLEDRAKDEFNPNVALEYGFMRALNKPALLLADKGFRHIRADITGTLRALFDLHNMEGTLEPAITRWLKEHNLCG